MKNYYFLVGSFLFIGGMVVGQATNPASLYTFNNHVKNAPITAVDGNKIYGNRDRVLEVYYAEDFDAGWNGWTAALQEGNVEFKLTSTGHQNSPSNTYQIPALLTSTPAQWVVLDSDADGLSGVSEAATLTSPVIDLAAEGVTVGDFIQMEFDQFFPEWQADETWIGVSTDGISWIEKEINVGVGREARPNPERITWDITDAVGADLSTVQIRFRWVGNWDYGWQIDNVKISELFENDLTVTHLYRTYDDGLMYSQVPLSHSKEMVVGAIVKNIGHIEQTGVGFDYVIRDASNDVVASGTASAGLTQSNTDADTILWQTGFTPDAVGTYTVEVTAISDQSDNDNDMPNNMLSDDFYTITPYTYAMDYPLGSKEPISFFPSADPQETTGSASFGNLFYFATADVASALEFEVADNPNIIGETVYTIVGRVDPNGSGDWVYDAVFEESITAEDLGSMKTIGFPEGYNVNSTELYLFMIGHYGWADVNEPQDYFMRQGDIQFNNRQGLDLNSEGRGFFDRKAPIVRVRLNADELSIDDKKVATFAFFPNPTADQLNIVVAAENEGIVINVHDMAGNLVETIDMGVINGGNSIELQVSDYASGMYTIEMVGQTNHAVKKFVKR